MTMITKQRIASCIALSAMMGLGVLSMKGGAFMQEQHSAPQALPEQPEIHSYESLVDNDFEDYGRMLSDNSTEVACVMVPGLISMGEQEPTCCASAMTLVATSLIRQGYAASVQVCYATALYGCEAEGDLAGKMPTAYSIMAAYRGLCGEAFACWNDIRAGLLSDSTGANNNAILAGFDPDLNGSADVCYAACPLVPLTDPVAVVGTMASEYVFNVACPAGYVKSGGADTATCIVGAGWTGDTLTCAKDTCSGTPEASDGVAVTCAGSEYMDECTAACADGFYLSEGYGYKCDVVGDAMAWVGNAKCAASTCALGDDEQIENMASWTCETPLASGATCTVTCADGFEARGGSTVECTSSVLTKWPQCIEAYLQTEEVTYAKSAVTLDITVTDAADLQTESFQTMAKESIAAGLTAHGVTAEDIVIVGVSVSEGRRLQEAALRRLGSAVAIDFKVRLAADNTAMKDGVVASLSTGQAAFAETFATTLETKATEADLEITVADVIVAAPAVVVEVEVTSDTTTTTTTTTTAGSDDDAEEATAAMTTAMVALFMTLVA